MIMSIINNYLAAAVPNNDVGLIVDMVRCCWFWIIHVLFSWTSIAVELTVDESLPKIAVAMTSIPPRLSALIPTLLSWCTQEIIPAKIYIFLPRMYKRFRRKSGNQRSTILESATRELERDTMVRQKFQEGWIVLIEMERDWGPITRFVGAMTLSDRWKRSPQDDDPDIDYWLIADDDVAYAPHTIHKYQQHLIGKVQTFGLQYTSLLNGEYSTTPVINTVSARTILSQFITDFRVPIRTNTVDDSIQFLTHVQGVDTYLFPNSQKLPMNSNFTLVNAVAIITLFHTMKCPESFYQDDYVVSLLFSLFGFEVSSIWNNENLAKHVDNVSKSHFQMHMSKDVFRKEEYTKACISTFAKDAALLIAP
jgi:hypothetical protein